MIAASNGIRAKRITSSGMMSWRLIAWAQLLVIVAVEVSLALYWRPQPHSDWLYYWDAAGDAEKYVRGGVGLWLLALPKALGLSAQMSALALNVPATVLVWWIAYRADGSPRKWFAQAAVVYLFLIAPFAGIVQLDLAAAALCAFGLYLLLRSRAVPRQTVALAIASIAAAVSTKPMYALTIWALIGFGVCVCALLWRRSSSGLPSLLWILLVASLLGFATDMGLRLFSGRTDEIRTSSAVTLYSGLLVSSDQQDKGCGYWSVAAAEAAQRDMDQALGQAVTQRLQAKPASHWISIVACKAPQIVSPPPYALYWLIESPNILSRIEQLGDAKQVLARYHQAIRIERKLYRGVCAIILLMSGWTAWRSWGRLPGMAALPVLWVASYWAVETVFEIQGRYFLGLFVIAPILCALVVQQARSRRIDIAVSTAS